MKTVDDGTKLISNDPHIRKDYVSAVMRFSEFSENFRAAEKKN